ncbi:MAG TPA: hypothetical protein VGW33_02045 [Terriglobia bacterium]|nr:hypothetical protein [Terriglobia bacterium]
MALLLRRRGINRVRPLEGGFDAWRERGYPLETRLVQVGPVGDASAAPPA